jgi:hypothetical protein
MVQNPGIFLGKKPQSKSSSSKIGAFYPKLEIFIREKLTGIKSSQTLATRPCYDEMQKYLINRTG